MMPVDPQKDDPDLDWYATFYLNLVIQQVTRGVLIPV